MVSPPPLFSCPISLWGTGQQQPPTPLSQQELPSALLYIIGFW